MLGSRLGNLGHLRDIAEDCGISAGVPQHIRTVSATEFW
jgi:hypothetical protein